MKTKGRWPQRRSPSAARRVMERRGDAACRWPPSSSYTHMLALASHRDSPARTSVAKAAAANDARVCPTDACVCPTDACVCPTDPTANTSCVP
eukprot:6200860-Pleurochrysis_carterae.AAC.2